MTLEEVLSPVLQATRRRVRCLRTLAVLRALESLKKVREKLLASGLGREVDAQFVQDVKKVKILSDNISIPTFLQQLEESPWSCRALFYECNTILAHLPSVSVAHTPREANAAADWIAKAHRRQPLPSDWITRPPQSLWDLLCLDSRSSSLCMSRPSV